MGVTCVCQVPLAEGKSVQQTVEILTRKLEQFGAEKQGTFYVDCETYHTAGANVGNPARSVRGQPLLPSQNCSSYQARWQWLLQRNTKLGDYGLHYKDELEMAAIGQAGKLLYVMHNSEHPLSTFALFENGPCLVADLNLDVLMVKLKGFFQNAKANKMETRGTRYQFCDFLVKIGTVTMGQSGRGISVEVDYCPCAVPGDCWNLMVEFMQSFMGNHAPTVPPVFGAKHDALYSPADTMVQYMELLNKIRKQQQQVTVAGMR